ncbi:acyl carrier protein [Oleispirillum naphthae]|uniref:acyl carrier protein n=1 Tax=Oleispirillum naphthae TaxID=2838853 RepID=UPI00308231E9
MNDFEKLLGVFRVTFGKPDLDLRPSLSAADVDNWDSFNHINLIIAIEEAFGVRLKTREVNSMKNVGDLVGILNGKGAAIAWPTSA